MTTSSSVIPGSLSFGSRFEKASSQVESVRDLKRTEVLISNVIYDKFGSGIVVTTVGHGVSLEAPIRNGNRRQASCLALRAAEENG
jgi:hypothetical protein